MINGWWLTCKLYSLMAGCLVKYQTNWLTTELTGQQEGLLNSWLVGLWYNLQAAWLDIGLTDSFAEWLDSQMNF